MDKLDRRYQLPRTHQ